VLVNSSRARRSLGSKTRSTLAARLKPVPSPKAAELSLGLDGSETRPYTTLGMDGSETRPYTTIRDPSRHGQARGRGGPYPPGVRLRSLSRVGSERPISHFSQKRREMGHPGCTPARCFREKHAEPKPQGVIVSSLQGSVVAYLYPALTRWAEIFRSCGAEMLEVGHGLEG